MTVKQHVDAMYAMRQGGATWGAISRHFGVHADTVRTTVLMIYPDTLRHVPPSVQRPPPKPSQFQRREIDVSRALAMRAAGMSMRAIGEALGVTGSTVCKRLVEAGYKVKKQPKRKAGQARYIRMTDEEFQSYRDNGGLKWFRSVLAERSSMYRPVGGVHAADQACTVVE